MEELALRRSSSSMEKEESELHHSFSTATGELALRRSVSKATVALALHHSPSKPHRDLST